MYISKIIIQSKASHWKYQNPTKGKESQPKVIQCPFRTLHHSSSRYTVDFFWRFECKEVAISALLSTGGAGPAQHKSATFIPKTDRFPAHNNHKNTSFQLPLFHQSHSLYLIKASRKHRFTFRILQGALLTFSNLPKRQRPNIDSQLIQIWYCFFLLESRI